MTDDEAARPATMAELEEHRVGDINWRRGFALAVIAALILGVVATTGAGIVVEKTRRNANANKAAICAIVALSEREIIVARAQGVPEKNLAFLKRVSHDLRQFVRCPAPPPSNVVDQNFGTSGP